LHERLHDSHQPATRPHSSGCPAGHGGGHSGHAKAAYDRSRGFAPNMAARGIIKPTQSAQNRPLWAGGADDSQWQGRCFQAAGSSSKQLKRGASSWQCATQRSVREQTRYKTAKETPCVAAAGATASQGGCLVTRICNSLRHDGHGGVRCELAAGCGLGCAIIARLTLPPHRTAAKDALQRLPWQSMSKSDATSACQPW
jgi:hypothetical protein